MRARVAARRRRRRRSHGRRSRARPPPAAKTVSLAVADAVVREGDRGTRTLAFVVRASGSPEGGASVDFATARGTASAPADYARASGSLRFDRRARTRTVSVRIAGDTADEFDETFRVVLSNASGRDDRRRERHRDDRRRRQPTPRRGAGRRRGRHRVRPGERALRGRAGRRPQVPPARDLRPCS